MVAEVNGWEAPTGTLGRVGALLGFWSLGGWGFWGFGYVPPDLWGGGVAHGEMPIGVLPSGIPSSRMWLVDSRVEAGSSWVSPV